MGWDAVVFGELRIGPSFALSAARAARMAEHEAGNDWPFQGAVEDESLGDVLDRWSRLRAPEYGVLWIAARRLRVAGYWSSATLLDEGASLLAMLSALGALGARGNVHVVGFGEDHGFALAVAARGVSVEALSEAQHRVLARKLAKHLERPKELPAAKNRAERSAKPKSKAESSADNALRELLGAPPYKKLPSRMLAGLRGLSAVGKARDAADVPWLIGLLRHPTFEVRCGAAEALLHFDNEAALRPVTALLHDTRFPPGVTMAAVAATFKVAPERAVDAFEPLLAAARKSPDAFDPAMHQVLQYLDEASSKAKNRADFAKFDLPRDVLTRDPRWHDTLVELASSEADGYSRTSLQILTRVSSPRLCDALVRAARFADADIDALERQLARSATRESIPILRRAAQDPMHPHAVRLGALADRLERKRRAD